MGRELRPTQAEWDFVYLTSSASRQDCGKLPACEAQNNPHQRGRAGKRWMKKWKIIERQGEYLQRSTLWRFKGENPKPGGTEEILSQCLAREGAKRDANKHLLNAQNNEGVVRMENTSGDCAEASSNVYYALRVMA